MYINNTIKLLLKHINLYFKISQLRRKISRNIIKKYEHIKYMFKI